MSFITVIMTLLNHYLNNRARPGTIFNLMPTKQNMNSFIIDFIYDGIPYRGLVTVNGERDVLSYFVKVESENQESYLEIVANPCGEDKMDWCFKDPDAEPENKSFDKNFLQEIGEAIEKHEVANS
jgi:hypothetical protein